MRANILCFKGGLYIINMFYFYEKTLFCRIMKKIDEIYFIHFEEDGKRL